MTKRELGSTLNTRKIKQYGKRGALKGERCIIKDRIDIEHGRAIVDEKQRIDDVEIDLVIGKGRKGALLTIYNHATEFLKMAKINSKGAHEVEEKIIELLRDLEATSTHN